MQAKNEMEAIKELNERIKDLEIKEGEWIPALSSLNEAAPSVSLTSQSGKFLKIGKLVFVQFYIQGQITSLSGNNNQALITGLPFSPNLLKMYSVGLTVSTLYNALENDTNAVFVLRNEGIKIQRNYGANTANWKITENFILAGSGCYETEE